MNQPKIIKNKNYKPHHHKHPKTVKKITPYKEISASFHLTCNLCQQQIKEPLTAFPYGNDALPVHFECLFNKITLQEKLDKNEEISYIGNFRFAVLKKNEKKISKGILRIIPIYKKEIYPDWIKKFHSHLGVSNHSFQELLDPTLEKRINILLGI